MRIWQRSAMAWMGTPVLSVMFRVKESAGVAAYRAACASVQVKDNSAI
jgi:hypothetical protein